jgi:hypothetical protein
MERKVRINIKESIVMIHGETTMLNIILNDIMGM